MEVSDYTINVLYLTMNSTKGLYLVIRHCVTVPLLHCYIVPMGDLKLDEQALPPNTRDWESPRIWYAVAQGKVLGTVSGWIAGTVRPFPRPRYCAKQNKPIA